MLRRDRVDFKRPRECGCNRRGLTATKGIYGNRRGLTAEAQGTQRLRRGPTNSLRTKLTAPAYSRWFPLRTSASSAVESPPDIRPPQRTRRNPEELAKTTTKCTSLLGASRFARRRVGSSRHLVITCCSIQAQVSRNSQEIDQCLKVRMESFAVRNGSAHRIALASSIEAG